MRRDFAARADREYAGMREYVCRDTVLRMDIGFLVWSVTYGIAFLAGAFWLTRTGRLKRRPFWQWYLLYSLIGVVVGLTYLLIAA